jgi:hypothetical protein
VPVRVRQWIGTALASPGFVLDAQPPAQPHSGVVVDHPVRFGGSAYFEVVRPSAYRAVQLGRSFRRISSAAWTGMASSQCRSCGSRLRPGEPALSSVHQELIHYLCGGIHKTAVEHEMIGCGPQRQRKDKHSDHRRSIHASMTTAHPVTMALIRQVNSAVLTERFILFQ